LATADLTVVASQTVDLSCYVFGTAPLSPAQRRGAIAVELELCALIVGLAIMFTQRRRCAEPSMVAEALEDRRLFQAFPAANQAPPETLNVPPGSAPLAQLLAPAPFEQSHPGAAAILKLKTQRR